jgi:hypothetical protein
MTKLLQQNRSRRMAINRTDMATKYLAPIDEAELAVRIVEANYQMRRPAGFTARQALDAMDPDARAAIQRAARAAMEYWRECIELMRPIN